VQAIDADNYEAVAHIIPITTGTQLLNFFDEPVSCELMKKPPSGQQFITPLAYAKHRGRMDIARLLKTHGYGDLT
jgi:hypothetical protein